MIVGGWNLVKDFLDQRKMIKGKAVNQIPSRLTLLAWVR
jgi:hypothetical protein